MPRFYKCKICGWETRDFSNGREIGNTGPALDELSEHFKSNHPELLENTNNELATILSNHVDVIVPQKYAGERTQ